MSRHRQTLLEAMTPVLVYLLTVAAAGSVGGLGVLIENFERAAVVDHLKSPVQHSHTVRSSEPSKSRRRQMTADESWALPSRLHQRTCTRGARAETAEREYLTGLPTIMRLLLGGRLETREKIRATFEKAGIEFPKRRRPWRAASGKGEIAGTADTGSSKLI